MDRNIRYNNLHGVAQSLALNMFQPFLGIFAIKLGAGNTTVALLSSLPALTSAAVMIPGAYWLERMPRRKGPTAVLFLASRVVLALLALVPLWRPDRRALLLAALIGLMNLPAAVASVSWQALCADIFPLASRAAIFAARNRWMALCGLAPTLAVGFFLDRLRFPLGYQAIFLVALAVSLLEIWFLTRLEEDGAARPAPRSRSLARIRGESGFWRFTLVSLCFHFPWQMGWPLFTIYQVRYLGATNLWTAIFAVTSTISSVATYGWWGRRAERSGTTRMLVLAAGGLALTPVFFALSSSLYPVALFNLAVGFFAAGANLLFFSGLLEVTPEEDRAAYIAYNNTLVNLSAFAAPLLGGLCASWLGIKAALVVTAVARLCGAAIIARFLALPARQLAQAPTHQLPPWGGKGLRPGGGLARRD
ncbi:MAG: MFS transporter [Patescibacteria group bacterium]